MKPFFVHKALLLKEWKEHRWWMIAAFVLLLVQPVWPWLNVLFGGGAGTRAGAAATTGGTAGQVLSNGTVLDVQHALFWKVLVPTIYGVRVTPNSSGYPASYILGGSPYLSELAGLTAMGLMIALITVERNRGVLWFTLSGPVSRRQQLRTKVSLAASIVLAALALKFLLLLGTDLYTNNMVPFGMVVRWAIGNALFELGLMVIGLAVASVVMVGMAAGLLALLVTAIPWAAARAILPVVPNPGSAILSEGKYVVALRTMHFVQALSPWHYAHMALNVGVSDGAPNGATATMLIGSSGPTLGLMTVWFLVWVAVWLWLGYWAYLNAPLENSNHFFLFPFLWVLALWILTALLCYTVVNATLTSSGLSTVGPFRMLVRIIEVWLPSSAVITMLIWGWLRQSGKAPARLG